MREGDSAFNPRVVAAVVAAGLVAFAGFILLLAYADDFRTGRDGRAHPLSVSAIGYSGLVKLIRLEGGEPRLIRNPGQRYVEGLVVATLEPQTDPEDLASLLADREDEPTLLVLPKWEVGPHPLRPDWVTAIGTLPRNIVPHGLKKVTGISVERRRVRGRGIAVGILEPVEDLRIPLPNALQGLSGERVVPLLVGPGGTVVLARIGDRPHYILADPDLLNNKGLKDPSTARTALLLLDRLSPDGTGGIAFDLVINGFGRKPGLMKLAFEPPFLALTLAIFVAALLAGLHGAFRFGPAVAEARAVAFGKAALVENSAGLFRLARREPAVGPAYAELIREAAVHDAGVPAGLQGEALDEYLDRLSPPDQPFSAQAAAAAQAGDRHQLLAAARRLFHWKKDLIK